jgi:hypothetical protein
VYANTPCVGEAFSLHAGAHPPCPSGALHIQTTSDRGKLVHDQQTLSEPVADSASAPVGELHAHGQHTTARTPSTSTSTSNDFSSSPDVRLWRKRTQLLLRDRLRYQFSSHTRRDASTVALTRCNCCSCPGLVTQPSCRVRLGLRSGMHPRCSFPAQV